MQAQLPKSADDNYAIDAKAEGNPTKDQMRLMMQSLLADRFKLRVHFESRQVPVLGLVLVKPGQLGPNLLPHSEGPGCAESLSRNTTMELLAKDLYNPQFGIEQPVVDNSDVVEWRRPSPIGAGPKMDARWLRVASSGSGLSHNLAASFDREQWRAGGITARGRFKQGDRVGGRTGFRFVLLQWSVPNSDLRIRFGRRRLCAQLQ